MQSFIEFNTIVTEAAQGHTIEAQGIRGMKNTAWRKTFKSNEHAYDWAEKNDATIHGTRDLDHAKKSNSSSAIKESSMNKSASLEAHVAIHPKTGKVDFVGTKAARDKFIADKGGIHHPGQTMPGQRKVGDSWMREEFELVEDKYSDRSKRDFKSSEMEHELGHEVNTPSNSPHAVHINGKKWKSFASQSHAANVAKKIKGATVHKEEYVAEALDPRPVAYGSNEETNLDKFKKYIRPNVKTTPKMEKTTNPAGRTTDHVEWKVTDSTGDIKRFKSKKDAQTHFDSFHKEEVELHEGTHLVNVTVSQPEHTMVSKRKEQIQKKVYVLAGDKGDAQAKAESFYKKKGFKVHGSEYHSKAPATAMKTE